MTLTLTRYSISALLLWLTFASSTRGGNHPPADPHAGQQQATAQTATIGEAAHIQPLRAGFNFPRQTLRYEAEYRFWTAGVATLKVERSGSQEHVLGTADSTGVVALLFKVQDRFES